MFRHVRNSRWDSWEVYPELFEYRPSAYNDASEKRYPLTTSIAQQCPTTIARPVRFSVIFAFARRHVPEATLIHIFHVNYQQLKQQQKTNNMQGYKHEVEVGKCKVITNPDPERLQKQTKNVRVTK